MRSLAVGGGGGDGRDGGLNAWALGAQLRCFAPVSPQNKFVVISPSSRLRLQLSGVSARPSRY
eukprot:scaffold1287_cov121-Isochrysis_galbana.AAC.3